MSYQNDRLVALQVVQSALALGLRVALAERGTYGYITDAEGQRVLSFGVDLGGVTTSGNYTAKDGRKAGTGWQIARHCSASIEDIGGSWRQLQDRPRTYEAYGTTVTLRTEQQYLAVYQASSKFQEITQEAKA